MLFFQDGLDDLNQLGLRPFAPKKLLSSLPLNSKYRIRKLTVVDTERFGHKIAMEYSCLNEETRAMEIVQSFIPKRINTKLIREDKEYKKLEKLCNLKQLWFEFHGGYANLMKFLSVPYTGESEDEQNDDDDDGIDTD